MLRLAHAAHLAPTHVEPLHRLCIVRVEDHGCGFCVWRTCTHPLKPDVTGWVAEDGISHPRSMSAKEQQAPHGLRVAADDRPTVEHADHAAGAAHARGFYCAWQSPV